jgi:hypothetical protein
MHYANQHLRILGVNLAATHCGSAATLHLFLLRAVRRLRSSFFEPSPLNDI